MTPQQKGIVGETWTRVLPIADTAAALFYGRLFEIDPGTRPLFAAVRPEDQRRKLMLALDAAVRGLDNLGALVPVIEALGRRHVGYGVTEAHYDSVGAALLWTLEKGLGAAWTAEAASAWAEAYALLSGVMRRAAREATSDGPAAKAAA